MSILVAVRNEREVIERILAELARQVALALHNSALDTALQASLVELRVRQTALLRDDRLPVRDDVDHEFEQVGEVFGQRRAGTGG